MEQENLTDMAALIQTAKDLGAPKDQVISFLTSGYVPQPKQWEFHAAARQADIDQQFFFILVGGARGGGKSHMVFAQGGLDDCLRYPGLKVLFLRKIQKAAGESMDDLVYRVLKGVEYDYTPSTGEIEIHDNGSKILVGGYKNESDIDKYLGIEYEVIIVEELSQLSEDKITKLRGSLRSSRPNFKPRIYATTNPGGIGHNWVKEHFIIPHRNGVIDHSFLGGYTKFIPATYKDNSFIDEGYISYLKELKGPLGKAWREGDWDVFEGMAFPNWDYDRHVCKPFYIPSHWTKWRAVDWGLTKPFCCLWFAKEPGTGRIYVYREIYYTGLTDVQQADMIKELTPPEEQILLTYADPSMWGRKSQEEGITTTAIIYAEAGVPLVKADNDRIGGRRKVSQLLGDIGDGEPGAKIFDICPHLTEQISSLPVDQNKPEDVDTDAEDHAYDCYKYGLTNMRLPSYEKDKDNWKWKKKTLVDIKIL